ncbi:hypothetical protein M1408_03260 [Candidatus Marsarchaeota archaeon]|jgi:hypothetical protein|nr:hypothetical protein [Candidatus Marsarchaeota archaeon]
MVSKSVSAVRGGIREKERTAPESSAYADSMDRNYAILRSNKKISYGDSASSTAVAGVSVAGGASALAAGAMLGGTGGLLGIIFGGTLMLFGFVAAIIPRRN